MTISKYKKIFAGVALALCLSIVAGISYTAIAQTTSGQVLFRMLVGNGNSNISPVVNSYQLGIGTTTPNAKLTVDATGGSANNLFLVASTTQGTAQEWLKVDYTGLTTASNLTVTNALTTGTFVVGTAVLGNMDFGGFNASDIGTLSAAIINATSTTNSSTFSGGFISSASSTVSAPFHVSDIIAGSSTLAIDQDAYFALSGGSVGIASSTPWAQFSVEKLTTGAPTFMVSDNGSTTPWFVVNENGNVGIGATTSNQRLDIDGDNPYISLFDSTSGAEVLIGSDLSRMQLWVDGSERASLTSGGNFGIGTTSPSAALSVTGTGEYVMYVNDETTDTSPFVIDGSGNVGIGTTTANQKLNLEASNPYISLNDTSSGSEILIGSDLNRMQLWTGGAEQVSLTNVGNFGIGTTSPNSLLGLSSSATSTITLYSTGAAIGGCIEVEDVVVPNTFGRMYFANGAWVQEAGACK